MSQLARQIKDIQFKAEKLISGNPDVDELEAFSAYNEELKNYMIVHVEDPHLRKIILEIPHVLELETDTKSVPFYVLIFLGIISLGFFAIYIAYIANARRARNIQNNIQTVRGKYASLEFMMNLRD